MHTKEKSKWPIWLALIVWLSANIYNNMMDLMITLSYKYFMQFRTIMFQHYLEASYWYVMLFCCKCNWLWQCSPLHSFINLDNMLIWRHLYTSTNCNWLCDCPQHFYYLNKLLIGDIATLQETEAAFFFFLFFFFFLIVLNTLGILRFPESML